MKFLAALLIAAAIVYGCFLISEAIKDHTYETKGPSEVEMIYQRSLELDR